MDNSKSCEPQNLNERPANSDRVRWITQHSAPDLMLRRLWEAVRYLCAFGERGFEPIGETPALLRFLSQFKLLPPRLLDLECLLCVEDT